MKPPLFLIATVAVLCACRPGGADGSAGAEKPRDHLDFAEQPAALDCSAARGDSARAVCLASQPAFPDSLARTVFEVMRRGDTVCVVTGPGRQMGTDGSVRTKVLKGAVVERVESDSIGCGERR